MRELREDAVEYIRDQLFGPAEGPDETIKGTPFWRYLCGILFPSDTSTDDLEVSDEPDAVGIASETEIEDPSIGLAYQDLPSSMGISFFIKGAETLQCFVEAAVYEKGEVERYHRNELAGPTSPLLVTIKCPDKKKQSLVKQEIFDKRAEIVANFRLREGGHLVTLSLVNRQLAGKRYDQASNSLFQCRFRVRLGNGTIGEYPTVLNFARHAEDEELALIYRNRKTFGIGHGCAAVWDPGAEPEDLREIRADPLPATEVRGLTNEIDLPPEAASVLSLQWLASEHTSTEELAAGLEKFAENYDLWIKKQFALSGELGNDETSKRIVHRQQVALKRIRKGIQALTQDGSQDVLRAFRISQEAMLRQFVWSKKSEFPKALGEGDTGTVDIWGDELSNDFIWRPFQLAFQLLVIESLADPTSEDRPVLDLLWFPTGGGKTEAYLALAAFDIALRRLRYMGGGAGTTVIMRYTLRLLTSQQFERCATLISVLETMRKDRPELGLGEDLISLGLWVGNSTTPNKLDSDNEQSPGAVQLLEKLLNDDKPENPFQLLKCPCCGTRIVPERRGKSNCYGLEIDQYRFRMFCPDEACGLHECIPVSVVDQDMYKRPPTVLIGTIDKFAQMAWRPESSVFLGMGSDTLAPSLIIQDELHLITGPLGTIAGTYEAAIDTVIKSKSVGPKYLAATATIQRVGEQARSLYAREASVFPPMGLNVDDSFFSREETEASGRMFIGAMGNGAYRGLTNLIQASAACAGAAQVIPENVKVPGRQTLAKDTYWTQVIYHNSKQELGKTTTTLRDDVDTRLVHTQPDKAQRRRLENIQELSANLRGPEVSAAIEHLEVEWDDPTTIDVLACTNMISVGVDVGRLGLMIVKGQPKSTSEYIQATSRVGREPDRPPGIVVVLYSANRPRDRSHYESFQAYHQSLYRAVEPVTVTPFAPPAQARTLHAAIVVVMRAVMHWSASEDAQKFDPNEEKTKSILASLKGRLLEACRDDEKADLEDHFDAVIVQWREEATKNSHLPLTFDGGRQTRELLGQFMSDTQRNVVWKTLNSMRHVDGATPFQVRAEQ